jgi:branched-chain amino acid transport system permease protein
LAAAAVLAALALAPLGALALDQAFYLGLLTRVVIMAIAAVSLNLILGYGGMVSFGHAAHMGIGGYAVGILASHGITSGFVQWPAAIAASSLYALFVGALSLRARGMYFIMITLAFAQMVYYLGAGAYAYGGDDGLTIYRRSTFAGLIDLNDKYVFYYLCLALLGASLYLCRRLVRSRFGWAVRGARANDRRMQALGFDTFSYRLVCFVIAGGLGGLSGALLATHTDFVSPAMMHWTRSGELIVMVVLGGMGTALGPVLGAAGLLLLEDVLSALTDHWQIIFGPLLVLAVLFARGGIGGWLEAPRRA